MVVLAARQFGGLHRPLAATVAAFGVLSALACAIGILRWLTVMPELATAHAAAGPELVPVAAAVSLLSVWMWAAGMRAFWRG